MREYWTTRSTDDVFVHEVLSWTKTSAGACTTQFVAPRAGELTKIVRSG